MLISTPCGRFPRDWPYFCVFLQKLGRLFTAPRRYSPAGSSAQAIPAGVAALRSNQRE